MTHLKINVLILQTLGFMVGMVVPVGLLLYITLYISCRFDLKQNFWIILPIRVISGKLIWGQICLTIKELTNYDSLSIEIKDRNPRPKNL